MNTNKKLKLVILLIALAIIYTDLFIITNTKNIVEESGDIKTFFCKIENCEDEFINTIKGAETLKCAFYDITNQKIIKQLKKENAKIITHNQEEFKQITTSGLMHHKFCIINKTHIITGSYNPTQINKHHENLIIIESKTLTYNYKREFEQIKKQNKYRTPKEQTKTTKIIYNNYTLKNYFCPQDNCQKRIIQEIQKANETIKFMLFTFTDQDIAKELVKKKKEGVAVRGIIENFQNKQYWQTPLLQQNNITVKIHSSNIFQHNKIFIIDNKIITGSYNPTRAGTTINDENILIITQPEIVKEYKKYFKKVYKTI